MKFNLEDNLSHKKSLVSELQILEQQYPIISDKALVDLINGMQVNKELISYQRRQSVISRVVDRVSGENDKRQKLIAENFHVSQRGFLDLFEEMIHSLNITQSGLLVAQNSLSESRQVIRHNKTLSSENARLINSLSSTLTVKSKQIQSEVTKLRLHLAANEEFENILLKWESGRTYKGLPWPIELILLTKETFSNLIGLCLYNDDITIDFRAKLIARFLKNRSDVFPNAWFSIKELLNFCIDNLDPNDLDILTAILPSRSIPVNRLIQTPICFMVSTALELATVGLEPENIGEIAHKICNAHVAFTTSTYDTRDFIEAVVEEVALDSVYLNSFNRTV